MLSNYPEDFILSANRYCQYDFDTLKDMSTRIDEDTLERLLYEFGFTELELNYPRMNYKNNYPMRYIGLKFNIGTSAVGSTLVRMRKVIGSKAFEYIYKNNGLENFYHSSTGKIHIPYKEDDLLLIPIQLGEIQESDIFNSNITTYHDLMESYTIKDLKEYYLDENVFTKEYTKDLKIRNRIFSFLYKHNFLDYTQRLVFLDEDAFNHHLKKLNKI